MGAVDPLMGALVTVVGTFSSAAVRTLTVDWVQNFRGLMIIQALMEKIGLALRASSPPAILATMRNVSRRPCSKLHPNMTCLLVPSMAAKAMLRS
jgi:hypothetical protein